MIKELLQGKLNPYFKSNVTLTAGQLVKQDPANPGFVIATSAGDVPEGIVAQDVIALTVDNYKLDSVTHKARVGDKVGVYFGGGVYLTDQFTGNVTAVNTPLYSGANGVMSTTASGNVVAYAETTGNSATAGTQIRVKFVIN